MVSKELVTLKDYLMGRDVQYASDYNDTIKTNALTLLTRVNMFLTELGIVSAHVSSGWRPEALNAATPNAATSSKHIIGQAIDIQDTDGSLRALVIAHLDIAKKYGLYFEDMRWTPTWVHMQYVPPKSGHRIYIPSTAPAIKPDAWSGHYDSFND